MPSATDFLNDAADATSHVTVDSFLDSTDDYRPGSANPVPKDAGPARAPKMPVSEVEGDSDDPELQAQARAALDKLSPPDQIRKGRSQYEDIAGAVARAIPTSGYTEGEPIERKKTDGGGAPPESPTALLGVPSKVATTTGQGLKAGLGDLAESIFRLYKSDKPGQEEDRQSNIRAFMAGDKLPIEKDVEESGKEDKETGALGWQTVAADISLGIADLAPKVALLEAAPEGELLKAGAAANIFGYDDKGKFDTKSATFAAAFPYATKAASKVADKALRAAYDRGLYWAGSQAAQRAVHVAANQAAMDAVMAVQDSDDLLKLSKSDPDEFKRRVAKMIGSNLAFGIPEALQQREPLIKTLRQITAEKAAEAHLLAAAEAARKAGLGSTAQALEAQAAEPPPAPKEDNKAPIDHVAAARRIDAEREAKAKEEEGKPKEEKFDPEAVRKQLKAILPPRISLEEREKSKTDTAAAAKLVDADREALDKKLEVVKPLTDEQLLYVMDPENSVLDRPNPRTPTGADDPAAIEWLRRHPEKPEAKSGTDKRVYKPQERKAEVGGFDPEAVRKQLHEVRSPYVSLSEREEAAKTPAGAAKLVDAERESTAKKMEIVGKLTDEQLLYVMHPDNAAKDRPDPTTPDGQPDVAAIEWLRRNPEKGQDTHALDVAAAARRVDAAREARDKASSESKSKETPAAATETEPGSGESAAGESDPVVEKARKDADELTRKIQEENALEEAKKNKEAPPAADTGEAPSTAPAKGKAKAGEPGKQAPAEPAKSTVSATTTKGKASEKVVTKPNPNAPPLRPTVEAPGGHYTGRTHSEAIGEARKAGEELPDDNEHLRGYTTQDGRFIPADSEEAKSIYEKASGKAFEKDRRLHSEDLISSKLLPVDYDPEKFTPEAKPAEAPKEEPKKAPKAKAKAKKPAAPKEDGPPALHQMTDEEAKQAKVPPEARIQAISEVMLKGKESVKSTPQVDAEGDLWRIHNYEKKGDEWVPSKDGATPEKQKAQKSFVEGGKKKAKSLGVEFREANDEDKSTGPNQNGVAWIDSETGDIVYNTHNYHRWLQEYVSPGQWEKAGNSVVAEESNHVRARQVLKGLADVLGISPDDLMRRFWTSLSPLERKVHFYRYTGYWSPSSYLMARAEAFYNAGWTPKQLANAIHLGDDVAHELIAAVRPKLAVPNMGYEALNSFQMAMARVHPAEFYRAKGTLDRFTMESTDFAARIINRLRHLAGKDSNVIEKQILDTVKKGTDAILDYQRTGDSAALLGSSERGDHSLPPADEETTDTMSPRERVEKNLNATDVALRMLEDTLAVKVLGRDSSKEARANLIQQLGRQISPAHNDLPEKRLTLENLLYHPDERLHFAARMTQEHGMDRALVNHFLNRYAGFLRDKKNQAARLAQIEDEATMADAAMDLESSLLEQYPGLTEKQLNDVSKGPDVTLLSLTKWLINNGVTDQKQAASYAEAKLRLMRGHSDEYYEGSVLASQVDESISQVLLGKDPKFERLLLSPTKKEAEDLQMPDISSLYPSGRVMSHDNLYKLWERKVDDYLNRASGAELKALAERMRKGKDIIDRDPGKQIADPDEEWLSKTATSVAPSPQMPWTRHGKVKGELLRREDEAVTKAFRGFQEIERQAADYNKKALFGLVPELGEEQKKANLKAHIDKDPEVLRARQDLEDEESRFKSERNYRTRVIGLLRDKLLPKKRVQARVATMDPVANRKTISADRENGDIAWRLDAAHKIYRVFSDREKNNRSDMNDFLTGPGSKWKVMQNSSLTRRIVFLFNSEDGKIYGVSATRNDKTKMTDVVNPEAIIQARRQGKELSEVMGEAASHLVNLYKVGAKKPGLADPDGKYRVYASVVVDKPVYNFLNAYDSIADFNEQFGDEADEGRTRESVYDSATAQAQAGRLQRRKVVDAEDEKVAYLKSLLGSVKEAGEGKPQEDPESNDPDAAAPRGSAEEAPTSEEEHAFETESEQAKREQEESESAGAGHGDDYVDLESVSDEMVLNEQRAIEERRQQLEPDYEAPLTELSGKRPPRKDIKGTGRLKRMLNLQLRGEFLDGFYKPIAEEELHDLFHAIGDHHEATSPNPERPSVHSVESHLARLGKLLDYETLKWYSELPQERGRTPDSAVRHAVALRLKGKLPYEVGITGERSLRGMPREKMALATVYNKIYEHLKKQTKSGELAVVELPQYIYEHWKNANGDWRKFSENVLREINPEALGPLRDVKPDARALISGGAKAAANRYLAEKLRADEQQRVRRALDVPLKPGEKAEQYVPVPEQRPVTTPLPTKGITKEQRIAAFKRMLEVERGRPLSGKWRSGEAAPEPITDPPNRNHEQQISTVFDTDPSLEVAVSKDPRIVEAHRKMLYRTEEDVEADRRKAAWDASAKDPRVIAAEGRLPSFMRQIAAARTMQDIKPATDTTARVTTFPKPLQETRRVTTEGGVERMPGTKDATRKVSGHQIDVAPSTGIISTTPTEGGKLERVEEPLDSGEDPAFAIRKPKFKLLPGKPKMVEGEEVSEPGPGYWSNAMADQYQATRRRVAEELYKKMGKPEGGTLAGFHELYDKVTKEYKKQGLKPERETEKTVSAPLGEIKVFGRSTVDPAPEPPEKPKKGATRKEYPMRDLGTGAVVPRERVRAKEAYGPDDFAKAVTAARLAPMTEGQLRDYLIHKAGPNPTPTKRAFIDAFRDPKFKRLAVDAVKMHDQIGELKKALQLIKGFQGLKGEQRAAFEALRKAGSAEDYNKALARTMTVEKPVRGKEGVREKSTVKALEALEPLAKYLSSEDLKLVIRGNDYETIESRVKELADKILENERDQAQAWRAAKDRLEKENRQSSGPGMSERGDDEDAFNIEAEHVETESEEKARLKREKAEEKDKDKAKRAEERDKEKKDREVKKQEKLEAKKKELQLQLGGDIMGVSERVMKELVAKGVTKSVPKRSDVPIDASQFYEIAEELRRLNYDWEEALNDFENKDQNLVAQIAVGRAHAIDLRAEINRLRDVYSEDHKLVQQAKDALDEYLKRFKPLASEAGDALRLLQGYTNMDDMSWHGFVEYVEGELKEGQKLTPEQIEEAKSKIEAHKKVSEERDRAVKELNDALRRLESSESRTQALEEERTKHREEWLKGAPEIVRNYIQGIESKVGSELDGIMARLSRKAGKKVELHTAGDPEFGDSPALEPDTLQDMSLLALRSYARGESLEHWRAQMIEQVGDWIVPYLERAWADGKETFDRGFASATAAAPAPAPAPEGTAATETPFPINAEDFRREAEAKDQEARMDAAGVDLAKAWSKSDILLKGAKDSDLKQGRAMWRWAIEKMKSQAGKDHGKWEVKSISQLTSFLQKEYARLNPGLPPMSYDEISRLMNLEPDMKLRSKEMLSAQSMVRQSKAALQAWAQKQKYGMFTRLTVEAMNTLFAMKVGGHGFSFPGTHAPNLMFTKGFQKDYWTKWTKEAVKIVLDPAHHEEMMQRLVDDPLFRTARVAGVHNDPTVISDDMQLYATQAMQMIAKKLNPKWGELVTALSGSRGADILKLMRQDMFNSMWAETPPDIRNRAGAQALAELVNHATGAPMTKSGKNARLFWFAASLWKGRVGWAFGDPAKAIGTVLGQTIRNKLGPSGPGTSALKRGILALNPDRGPEAMYFAKKELASKAHFLKMFALSLAVNQGLLMLQNQLFGTNQEINFTKPWRRDWLHYKAFGYHGSPFKFLWMMSLIDRVFHIADDNKPGKRSKNRPEETTMLLGQALAGKVSPGVAMGLAWKSGTDFMGRPLPWRDDINPPARQPGEGEGDNRDQYTYFEWLLAQGPIPISEATHEVIRSYKAGEPSKTAIGEGGKLAVSMLRGAAAAGSGMFGYNTLFDPFDEDENPLSGLLPTKGDETTP